MSAEADGPIPALPAVAGPLPRPDHAAARLIARPAELVVLAEELYVRLFGLALVFVLISSLVSIWFDADARAPLAVTLPLSLAATAFALAGLSRPRQVYGWLRYAERRQLAPALVSAASMVVTGPDSPLWWPALALVILVTAISSLWLSMAAAVVCAGGYVAGTVLGGEAIIRGGEAGILAGAVGFIAYTLVGAFVCEAFAGFVLAFQRLERLAGAAGSNRRSRPRRVASVVLGDERTDVPPAPAPGPAEAARDVPEPGASPLTPRQLEVVLLIRDGLNQSEAAASLGISRRQVERLLGEARLRAGAATTSHLMAMLVTGELQR